MSRTGIMLCYQFDSRRFMKYGRAIVQPKLEGDRCRALVSARGEVLLLSSGAKPRTSVPHIAAALRTGFPVPEDIELDGELYIHGQPHEYIRSIVSRTVSRHPSYREVEYWVFDVVSDAPQWERIQQLNGIPFTGPIKHVPNLWVSSERELAMAYESFLSEGYEGIIIRDSDAPYVRKKTPRMMKLKPRMEGVYVCIGYFEEYTIDGEAKGALGGLILGMEEGLDFRVGTGFTRADRNQLWEQQDKLPGQKVLIKYQALTERGVPKMAAFQRFV